MEYHFEHFSGPQNLFYSTTVEEQAGRSPPTKAIANQMATNQYELELTPFSEIQIHGFKHIFGLTPVEGPSAVRSVYQ